jgi:hypothetical protein
MGQTTVLVTIAIGLVCCCWAITLIDARAPSLSDALGTDLLAKRDDIAAVAAPPHHMRGWAHSPPRPSGWPGQP